MLIKVKKNLKIQGISPASIVLPEPSERLVAPVVPAIRRQKGTPDDISGHNTTIVPRCTEAVLFAPVTPHHDRFCLCRHHERIKRERRCHVTGLPDLNNPLIRCAFSSME